MKNGTSNKSFKRFLIIWLGELFSSVGSGLTAFALSAYALSTTGKTSAVSIVMLCGYLPSILLSPLAGILADRFDRRLMMVLGDGLSALGLIYMLVARSLGFISIWQICIGVSVSSVFTSLLEPSYKATISDLLTEEEFSRASGLVQLAGSAKYLLSPLIAGFLLTFTGIETILIIDISTLLVTVIAVLVSRQGMAATINEKALHEPFFVALREGWEAITERRGVLKLIMLASALTFFVGFAQTLFMPMILSFADTKTLGIIESASAIGMLISSVFLGMVKVSPRYVRQLAISVMIAGFAGVVVGMTTSIFLMIPAGFLFFACLPFANMSVEVLIRTNVENEKQGRVWGLMGIISQLGYVIAYVISGPLADFVFTPLLIEGGILAPTLGRVFGVGPWRGVGMLFSLFGLLAALYAPFIPRSRSIRALERV